MPIHDPFGGVLVAHFPQMMSLIVLTPKRTVIGSVSDGNGVVLPTMNISTKFVFDMTIRQFFIAFFAVDMLHDLVTLTFNLLILDCGHKWWVGHMINSSIKK